MNDLSERLAHQAEGFDRRGGTPLHLDQVLERAGEIKRGRRLRATLVMAAAVLAIAVPAALVAGRSDERPVTPAGHAKADTSPLTLQGLARGDRPKRGYATGSQFQLPRGAIGLPVGKGTVADVAPLRGGLLVAVRSPDGALTAHFVDEQGATGNPTWPMEGGFAVSAGGNVGAFVRPDGTPVAVQDAGSSDYELPAVPRGSGFTALAVQDEHCEATSEQTACAVWVSSAGEKPETWVTATRERASRMVPTLRSVSDVSHTDLVAGTTKVTDPGSCSAVIALPAESPAWSTCDHRLLTFSPDSKHLLASAAYADGAGDTGIAILDSATGQPVLDLRTADGAFIGQLVWEDDSHVLATVSEGGRWAVVRVGLDGSREYAVAPVTGKDPYESPFVLPSR